MYMYISLLFANTDKQTKTINSLMTFIKVITSNPCNIIKTDSSSSILVVTAGKINNINIKVSD